ncbi:MAG: protein-glutamate O-methyltransferase CheR [Bdellovibrionaceae bacterium]|nr:protein-glutamate O-methyltransferase CheR [Pseudobdellovibrionaceae bacterium]
MTDFPSILFPGDLPLLEEDFEFFRDRLLERAGIDLKDGKKSLVQARLGAHLRSIGLKGFAEYRRRLEGLAPDDGEWQIFVNLLTTNKTDFFREPAHFKFLLETFLPKWRKAGGKHLKVWSAACSTGQEPYTLAMCLKAALPPECDFSILATDIDTAVLKEARNAVYPRHLLSQIPVEHRNALSFGSGEIEGWMRIRPDWRKHVSFRTHNLIEGEPPPEGPFDVIFCRNVLIYFSRETIVQVVGNLARSIGPDGVFMISHSESLHGLPTPWQNIRPSVLVKKKRT